MTAEEMICPHCRARLRKSAAAHVLGSSRFLVMGDLPGSTPCPACGGPLDSAAMIRAAITTSSKRGALPKPSAAW